MNRILIVEDESSISDFVKGELEYEGYEVCIKEDGREGLEEALNNEYDLVILDIMLPSMNGFEICRRIKRVKATPVIMLSAKSSVIDKVNGLKLGADDYISKPFAIEELLARIEVVFRRESNPKDSIFKFKDITIDTKSRIVKRNNEEINLTNKEYELLMILIENRNTYYRWHLSNRYFLFDNRIPLFRLACFHSFDTNLFFCSNLYSYIFLIVQRLYFHLCHIG